MIQYMSICEFRKKITELGEKIKEWVQLWIEAVRKKIINDAKNEVKVNFPIYSSYY